MAVKFKSGFEVLRFSDLDYEEMTVEIQYKAEQIAQINMDSGIDKLEIEFFTEFLNPSFEPVFQVNQFLEALNEAIKIFNNYKEQNSAVP